MQKCIIQGRTSLVLNSEEIQTIFINGQDFSVLLKNNPNAIRIAPISNFTDGTETQERIVELFMLIMHDFLNSDKSVLYIDSVMNERLHPQSSIKPVDSTE